MNALNNLGVVASERRNLAMAREYSWQSLALAREIGSQQMIALGLINLADWNIQLGYLASARTGLCEELAQAWRLGVLSWAMAAVLYFAKLAHAEGGTEQALALLGLARQNPNWSSDDQHDLDAMLAEWALDPSVVEAGMQAGESLDWETTIKELLKG